MVVTVRLHTILQRQTPQGLVRQVELTLPEGSELVEILRLLEVNLDLEALLLAVNGRTAEPEHVLQDGDLVDLIPAIEGGMS